MPTGIVNLFRSQTKNEGLNSCFMMPHQISRIRITGYKSIQSCDLALGKLNILIGPNGAGKSNFISFFRLLRHLFSHNLQFYVGKQGGPDALLHFGRSVSPNLGGQLFFEEHSYRFTLAPTADNKLIFSEEIISPFNGDQEVALGHAESIFPDQKGTQANGSTSFMQQIKYWRVYHFHDTGENARLKQLGNLNDYRALRADGSNLAAFLYFLKNKYPQHFHRILKTLQLVAPFFGNFLLEPNPYHPEKIELEWLEQGNDIPFKAHILSDGTLRFICLATLLLQPEELQPETILIDEPELGLHPYAIQVLASMLRSVSVKKQLIISTQSTELLNQVELEHVIIAERKNGLTHFFRPDAKDFEEWMEEYSLGELWQKNLLGGRP
ncbi:putative ATPase [Cyclonatronum proteinivorum]|uniref:Putative ATPase n=2 Tax=Cyclonatronum proteinivorum TaxID=1457365 RepID=A0A345UPL5_9BACT|nr:putative ATPase [Cyclonatronum proteinivorum]